MGTVNRGEMRAAESTAMDAGWSEERLLDLAGTRLGHAIGRFFPHPGTAIGYLGKGHNAGDALVALRVLRDEYGWKAAARCAFAIEDCAPLTRRKWEELGLETPLHGPPPCIAVPHPMVLLDGLLGIGATGALCGAIGELSAEMECLRQHSGAMVAAVDLPSGLDPDSGATAPGSITADITFLIGNAKTGALKSSAVNTVGALVLVPVEILATPATGPVELIAPQEMDFGKAVRPFDFHKGLAGKVALVAGSAAYPGAAVLAATGALRAGAGLVTLHVPEKCAAIIAAKCPPEIIIRSYGSFRDLDIGECDSLVVGCGLGETDDTNVFLDWLATIRIPTVIDADALNWIAKSGRDDVFRENHVLTPHPGEFRRLAPDLRLSLSDEWQGRVSDASGRSEREWEIRRRQVHSHRDDADLSEKSPCLDNIQTTSELPREEAARLFTDRHNATLLLKGGRSLVTRRGHPLWVNSTGTPGMATGGQGDLLSGVIGALLASGLPNTQAAALGAWLCGRASEIACTRPGMSVESLTPSDTALNLGAAFRDWREAAR